MFFLDDHSRRDILTKNILYKKQEKGCVQLITLTQLASRNHQQIFETLGKNFCLHLPKTTYECLYYSSKCSFPYGLNIAKHLHWAAKIENKNIKGHLGSHFSIVTERSPQACNPASTNEVLLSATCPISSGFLTSSCIDMSVKAFNMSMDITRHVIVLGTFKTLFPELTKERRKEMLLTNRSYTNTVPNHYDKSTPTRFIANKQEISMLNSCKEAASST